MADDTQRDKRGRFAKGWAGGPGRPCSPRATVESIDARLASAPCGDAIAALTGRLVVLRAKSPSDYVEAASLIERRSRQLVGVTP